jgi:hypothetical protein
MRSGCGTANRSPASSWRPDSLPTRESGLLALHPKLKAPLYAITLPGLKAGLISELHRPAAMAAKKPLAEILRLVEWDRLKTEVEQMGERVRYLKPEFLEGISEPVVPPRPR